ncbi:MAG: rod shape-determining protein MreC [Lachnospiraceae bacterium]|nr:rod shape-determining protein MreC [Lachnospiraceae bacterium]
MKKRSSSGISNKYWLLFLSLICIALMVLSAFSEQATGVFRVLANVTVVPLQSGVNHIGTWLGDMNDNFETMEMLRTENQALQTEVNRLSAENNLLVQDKFELQRLQELFQLDQQYADYETIGARVVGISGNNWFNNFTINRGSLHGVRVDMNIIAGNGLVGIVTDVGPTWSTVRSIIDDVSNVSGMVLATSDRTIVRGDLTLINEGRMRFEQMENNENPVAVGDQIVTSYISNLFLQGLLIGYISEVNVDSNNLTRSGYIVPAVDFQNIQEVLVIMQTKADVVGMEAESIAEEMNETTDSGAGEN